MEIKKWIKKDDFNQSVELYSMEVLLKILVKKEMTDIGKVKNGKKW